MEAAQNAPDGTAHTAERGAAPVPTAVPAVTKRDTQAPLPNNESVPPAPVLCGVLSATPQPLLPAEGP